MATSRLHPSRLVSELGAVQGSSPTDEHLFLHLDASRAEHLSIDTSTATGNVVGNVTEWRNNWKGRDNQMVFVSDISTEQPEYHSDAVNGLHGLWFPGSGGSQGRHLYCVGATYPGSSRFHNISSSSGGATGSIGLATGSGSDEFTLFCVVAFTDSTTVAASSGNIFGDNNDCFVLQARSWTPQCRFYVGRDGPMGTSPNDAYDFFNFRDDTALYTGPTGTESHLFHATYDGTTGKAYKDSVIFNGQGGGSTINTASDLYFPSYSVTYQTGVNSVLDSFTLGASRGDNTTWAGRQAGFRGYLCELIMFDKYLSATQITEINAGLSAKWGTP